MMIRMGYLDRFKCLSRFLNRLYSRGGSNCETGRDAGQLIKCTVYMLQGGETLVVYIVDNFVQIIYNTVLLHYYCVIIRII